MNIGNITSDNFNLDSNGKDIQIEVYEQLIEQLQQENQELKKQLHEASIEMQEMIEQDIECPSNCSKLKDLDKIEKSFIEIKNQQKEFIKWLEDYLNLFDYRNIQEQAVYDMLEEILQKY